MARPEAKIDLAELEKLCGMQCTDEEVAAFFGVSTRTIERRRKVPRFNEVILRGKAKGRMSVRRNLFRLANAGNVAAAIFLAKTSWATTTLLPTSTAGPTGRRSR